MPFETLTIIPSVDIEETLAANAQGISESNFIRWREKYPEKRGGCVPFVPYQFAGVAKELHAWQGLQSDKRLAVGCTDGLYVTIDSQLRNITPQAQTHNVAPDLSVTVDSSIVTINNGGLISPTIYDVVIFNSQVSIGNILLSGAYQITNVTGTYSFQIESGIRADETTNIEVVPLFKTTERSSVIRMEFPNVNPELARLGVTDKPFYYDVGNAIAFLAPTEVGGVTISGEYTVTKADREYIEFNAQNSATQTTQQLLNYGSLALQYYVTIGPQQQGKGYGQGFYSSFNDVADVLTATSSNGFATLTFNGAHYYQDGETATVAGVGAPYDGSHFLTQAEYNFITYACGPGPNLGAGGTISAYHGSGGYGTGIPAPPGARGVPIKVTNWWLDNWGEKLIATQESGPIFIWSTESGYYNAAMIPQAPLKSAGAMVVMPQRQIMAWGTTYTGVQDPLQIRWCDYGNFSAWNYDGINAAGGYRIPTGSLIVGALQGPQQQYWFTDIDVYVSQWTGGSAIYGFNKIGAGCGLIAPKAMTMLGSNVYWMSQKQFFAVSGSNAAQPIPCSVWDFVFQNLNPKYIDKIIAASNSQFNEVTWYFPTANSVSGENDAYVCFNVLYNEWDYGYLSRTAWIDQSVLGPPMGTSFTASNSTGYSTVFQHEISYNLDGQAINAFFKTGYFSIGNGNDLCFVDWMLPDMKWGTYSGSDTAKIEISFYVTDYTGDQPRKYGPYVVDHTTQFIEPRFRGRFVQIEVRSNDLNSFWRLGSIRYRYAIAGRR